MSGVLLVSIGFLLGLAVGAILGAIAAGGYE